MDDRMTKNRYYFLVTYLNGDEKLVECFASHVAIAWRQVIDGSEEYENTIRKIALLEADNI
jgi:hypothetical protein